MVIPVSDDQVIWRYLNAFELLSITLSKKFIMRHYLSLIKSDSMEGKLPWAYVGDEEDSYDNNIDIQKQCYVSCWNMGPDENALLWRVYAPRGFAIKTTVGKLDRVLNDGLGMQPGHPAPLQRLPVDYQTPGVTVLYADEQEVIELLARKRSSFAAENELRYFAMSGTVGPATFVDDDHGGFLSVPLGNVKWIDDIYCDPSLAEWAIGPVVDLLRQHGLSIKRATGY